MSAKLETKTISKRIKDLSPEKREFLNRLLRSKGLDVSKVAAIPRRKEADSYPLSFAQQRLWVLHQLDPGNPSYNMPSAIRLTGPLNVTALERSLGEIIRRHESLRTTFRTSEDGPVQIIHPVEVFNLPVGDLSALTELDREAEIRRLASAEAQRRFDLVEGPVIRAALIRIADDDHVILFTMHHIVSDGWSIGVLVREFVTLYEAFSNDKESPLTEPPIQYADYSVWQRDWIQGDVLQNQLTYWKEALAGAPPVLELPADRPRPVVQTVHGAGRSFEVNPSLTGQLNELSKREESTLFMTLIAAFKILLHRYSGQDDIVVGTPVAGRNRVETEELIGFFANTLVLRTDLSGISTFRELLRREREITLGATAHQDLPFEKIVEELQPERSLSHMPIFQVMFVLQNVPRETLDLPGLKLSPVAVTGTVAKFDLTLLMQESDAGLDGYLEYNTDLFDHLTMQRMIGHFKALLESIVANPDLALSQLALLTEAEQQQMLLNWNDTRTEYSRDKPVHEMFEAQVKRTPKAIAVRFQEGQITYEQLNERANQLARYLIGAGAGPDVLVGICIKRSIEMIVAVLGVLKSGSAYVPIDASYPRERLAYMVEDAQASILLAQSHSQESLPECKARTICLDTEWETIAAEDSCNLPNRAEPNNLAYVIYTSGSTGQPKGVMITHQGLNNYLSWCTGAYAAAQGEGAPLHTPITFDLTVTSLFPPLMVGGCVEVLPEEQGIEALSAALCSGKTYSLVKITPAHLEMLSRMIPVEGASVSVNALIIGGEALVGGNIALWQRHWPKTRLINEYGPTETVVGCSVYEVPEGLSISGAVPIGRPVANAEMYVMDRHLQPVPVGVVGELYIGGDGVARGYLNRPDLTAERFLPDPFSKRTGARLYRTGDRARFIADGNLEYNGRIDQQVKIRGFRIELSEIEEALSGHPLVRESIVVARDDSTGEKRLVAYVVNSGEEAATISDMRRFLREKIPHYMVPSSFVILESLPLTENGKVDHDALPERDEARPDVENAYVKPRNIVELQIEDIWEEVLNIRPVGVTDNFFDLGGHSVLALRVIAQIQRLFGYDLPLSTFFDGGTIENLANIIRKKGEVSRGHIVGIRTGGSKLPLFLMHPIGGGVVCYAYLARRLDQDQPVYGLQAIEVDQPNFEVRKMVTTYMDAMRQVQPHGPYLLLGWSFGATLAFEVAQQLTRQGEEIRLLAIIDSVAPDFRPWSEESLADYDDPIKLIRTLEGAANRKEPMPVAEDYLRQLGRDDQLLYIMEQAKKARIMPQELTLAQIKRSLENHTARIRACHTYVPELYPGRITLFKSTINSNDEMDLVEDPTWGWGKWSQESVDLCCIPGDHVSIVNEPDVQVLAEKLRACISRTEED